MNSLISVTISLVGTGSQTLSKGASYIGKALTSSFLAISQLSFVQQVHDAIPKKYEESEI